MKKLISLLIVPLFIIACGQTKEDQPADAHDHSADDAHQHAGVQLTLYADGYEMFTEMGEAVVGERIDVLAHFTKLDTYKPVDNATVYMNIIMDGKTLFTTKKFTKHKAGIYEREFRLSKEGNYDFEFVLETGDKVVRFLEAAVHACGHHHEDEAHAEEEIGVKFLKEQAWKVDFATTEVVEKDFNYTVKASGELLPARGGFQGITAKSSGIINFIKPLLDDGTFVNKGDALFSISGKGLSENNIENRFAVVSNQYEKSKADFNRKKMLYQEKIVSTRAYEESFSQFKIDSTQYYNLLKEYQVSGIQITAPISGNIYELTISNGDYVVQGQTIAQVLDNKKMRIHVDVPQRHFALLDDIRSLNFKTSYSDNIFTLQELNGRLLTRGSYATQNSGFVPVIFEIDNHGLLAGSFVECWLQTNPIPNRIVIPKSALIEEQGSFYVYVQTNGETYEKRYVKLNVADGKQVWVTEGLEAGERIVSKGAMLVKVSAATGSVPVHQH